MAMCGVRFSKVGWGMAEIVPENCRISVKIAIFDVLLSDGLAGCSAPPWPIWLKLYTVVGAYCGYVWCKF